MANQEFCPICMTEEYWMNSQLSIARHYGGIKTKIHEYKIVNKQGITLWELSDPCFNGRTKFDDERRKSSYLPNKDSSAFIAIPG